MIEISPEAMAAHVKQRAEAARRVEAIIRRASWFLSGVAKAARLAGIAYALLRPQQAADWLAKPARDLEHAKERFCELIALQTILMSEEVREFMDAARWDVSEGMRLIGEAMKRRGMGSN